MKGRGCLNVEGLDSETRLLNVVLCSPELCEVLETDEAGTEGQVSGPVQYQCLDCLALFDSPEVWLAHRQTHSKSSTHSATETVSIKYQHISSENPSSNGLQAGVLLRKSRQAELGVSFLGSNFLPPHLSPRSMCCSPMVL